MDKIKWLGIFSGITIATIMADGLGLMFTKRAINETYSILSYASIILIIITSIICYYTIKEWDNENKDKSS